jgi:replicative DNA helicase
VTLNRAVERSAVGALLLEPSRLDDVRDWLELEDFDGTAERQAFGAILALQHDDQEISPQAVERRVRASVAQGTQLADAPYLLTVMRETPMADRAAVYGRMVLELSIRRRVAEGAVRLRQEAEHASSSGQLNQVFADVDSIRRSVEALHRRESRAAETHSVAPATDEQMLHLLRLPRHADLAAEEAAILTLVDRPAHILTVSRWLRPNDFGDDECGALFKEIVALREAHDPVDRLTVAWRAAKVGIDGPLCRALSSGRQDLTPLAHPVACSRRVLEQSVKAALLATSDELESSAADASVNPTTAAYTRLNALWPQQRRLVKAQVASVRSPEG